jgi:hypothetical protein
MQAPKRRSLALFPLRGNVIDIVVSLLASKPLPLGLRLRERVREPRYRKVSSGSHALHPPGQKPSDLPLGGESAVRPMNVNEG